MNVEEIGELLTNAWDAPSVIATADEGTFLVQLPWFGHEHESLTAVLRSSPDGWLIEDDGQVAFWLGADFHRIVEPWLASGSGLEITDDNRLVCHLGEISRSAGNALEAVSEFRQIIDSRHLMDAIRELHQADERGESSTGVMAREVRALFERAEPRWKNLVSTSTQIGSGFTKAKAPLAVRHPNGKSVLAVSTFIDLEQGPQTVRAAMATTSLVINVARHHRIDDRLVVVRGDDGMMADDVRSMYMDVAVVATSVDHQRMLDTLTRGLRDLIPAA